MNRNTKKATTPINLVLDDGIALEALLLNRLASLPKTRRKGWLQGLLVRGFCQECAEIQALQPNNADRTRYVPSESPTTRVANPKETATAPKRAPNGANSQRQPSEQPVSLSSLRAVVG